MPTEIHELLANRADPLPSTRLLPMLVTQHPVFRRFWYPVMPLSHLRQTQGQPGNPQPFQLLGQRIVLWLTPEGTVAAVEDRCCHRTAQLSRGCVVAGCIQCPYHGWQFDATGACVKVPQLQPHERIPASYKVKAFQTQIRYDYAWVCLEPDPLLPIPDFPEAEDPRYRVIHDFYEAWQCSAFSFMENVFDNAHFSIVHTRTFGDTSNPIPAISEIRETDYGFHTYAEIPAVNNDLQKSNLGMKEDRTLRCTSGDWFMPFLHRGKIVYPNGLEAILFVAMTPIDDYTSQMAHFWIRSDREEDAPAANIIAFNRQVMDEDRVILETIPADRPLAVESEQHMLSDKPSILMRRKLMALLRESERGSLVSKG
ncbi:MAG: aromatic ring-hydroxylating dioxygenase subunit alpha [Thermostichus sp. HHBFW_bins_43]